MDVKLIETLSDGALFETLTPPEARAILGQFLREGEAGIRGLQPAAVKAGIALDFSVASASAVLRWMIARGRLAHRTFPLPAVPDWLLKATPALEREMDFDEATADAILSGAYYLGECYVQQFQGKLHWGTGAPGWADQNNPVVQGFRDAEEMPPVRVVRVMFGRVLKDSEPVDTVAGGADYWLELVP